MTILTLERCRVAAESLGRRINELYGMDDLKIWGVPRGGFNAALLLCAAYPHFKMVEDPNDATIAIDDIIGTGRTAEQVMQLYNIPTAVLYTHDYNILNDNIVAYGDLLTEADGFVNFPWEFMFKSNDYDSAHDSVIRMLCAIGEDPNREGLKETPARVVKAWKEWFKGYNENPADVLKVFEDGAEGYGEMVLLTNIPVYSHCEHHVTPFVGVAHVAYIPNGKIVGISKLARIVEIFSRRLQVQERLTNQIADALEEHLKPQGVAVVVQAKHFCMATRGVKMPNVDTHTSAMRGAFFDNVATRAEFMSLVRAAS